MRMPRGRRARGRRPAVLLSVVAVCIGSALIAQPALAASTWALGVDVSHWQGPIDWAKVHGAGIDFTFAKATQGQTYVDPTFATNRARAQTAGLQFGAYHYADPQASPDDAVLQAEHFLSVARPRAGEFRGSLDLEESGGLSVNALQNWVWAWLQKVKAVTGKRAIIYTNPAFWKTYMGNSTAFAGQGYKLLWIANWNVTDPNVPAGNWAGYGWTFWQWTDCGSVPGITGCVDEDYYHGTHP